MLLYKLLTDFACPRLICIKQQRNCHCLRKRTINFAPTEIPKEVGSWSVGQNQVSKLHSFGQHSIHLKLSLYHYPSPVVHVFFLQLYTGSRPCVRSHKVVQALSHVLAKIPVSSRRVIVGDLNEDLRTNLNSTYRFLITEHCYKQVVKRQTTNYCSLLDHVYIKDFKMNAACGVADIYFSDHDMTVVSLNV